MTAHSDLSAMRRAYARQGLSEATADDDPLAQFALWLADAVVAGLPEPNAMVLATATPDGVPSARTVLLKGYGEQGFTFFTNRESQKGQELAANPRAALLFPWHPLERQVRITGPVTELSRDEVSAYFSSRPHGSRLGAWASPQSQVVTDRAELDERFAAMARQWPEGQPVPAPDFWGGYRVVPETIEFWAGRDSRMHDRLRYRRDPRSGVWIRERLAP